MSIRVCKYCKNEVDRKELDANFAICPKCGKYFRFHARKRIASLADEGSFVEWDKNIEWSNPLDDQGYTDKLQEAAKKHNLNDAIITGQMKMSGIPLAIGVMDTRFMMASMGHVVGEKITLLFEKAIKKKLPVLLFCCSGGARMQEGIISLMQMEKTSAVVRKHSEAGLLYISVLTNPTMGGVTASYATLADIVLAEKGAMIGFAGARVIEQNTKVKLPEGFQTAEFQLKHGFVDEVLSRETSKEYITKLLQLHAKKNVISFSGKAAALAKKSENKHYEFSAWDTVLKARASKRPTTLDYVNQIFDEFIEFHGDRTTADDPAIVGGIATIFGKTVTVIGQQKGKHDINEAIFRNWGMPSPSGYRKAIRLMREAEKFNRPIVCFVDTIGAACGVEAEEQGQGYVIADILREAALIKVPVVSIIHGEGGSGGALALGVGNEVWILQNAVYSILTPEGYASILWKDNAKASEAAELMKLTSKDLYDLKVVDKVFEEPETLSVDTMGDLCEELKNNIGLFIKKYSGKSGAYIAEKRYERFRRY